MAKHRRPFTVKHRVRLHRVEQLEDRCLMAGDVVAAPWDSIYVEGLQHGAPDIVAPRITVSDAMLRGGPELFKLLSPPAEISKAGNGQLGVGIETGSVRLPGNTPPPVSPPPVVPAQQVTPFAKEPINVASGLPAVFGAGGIATGGVVATDAAGNVYMSGRFLGTLDFDPGPGLDLHDSGRGTGLFVIKLTAQGDLAWARSFENMGAPLTSPDFSALAVDANSGRVYLTGVQFPDSYHQDVTLISLDAEGELLWTRELTGSWFMQGGTKLAVDRSGNLLVAGSYCGRIDLDPGPGEFILNSRMRGSNLPESAAFVAKYTASGELIWADNLTCKLDDSDTQAAPSDTIAYDLALDGADNVYITGHFAVSLDVDPGPDAEILTGGGIFVTKLDASGSLVWGKAFGPGAGRALAADALGNVFLVSVNGDVHPSRGYSGTNVAHASKLDANGNVLWERALDDSIAREGWHPADIAVDSSGDLYVTGSSLYVARLGSDGDVVWSHAPADPVRSSGGGIAVDDAGNIYATGRFIGAADFDPGPQSLEFATPSFWPFAYLWKLDSSGNVAIVESARSQNDSVDAASPNQTNILGAALGNSPFDAAPVTDASETPSNDLIAPPDDSSRDVDNSLPASPSTEIAGEAPSSSVWDVAEEWSALDDELAWLADLSEQGVGLPIEA